MYYFSVQKRQTPLGEARLLLFAARASWQQRGDGRTASLGTPAPPAGPGSERASAPSSAQVFPSQDKGRNSEFTEAKGILSWNLGNSWLQERTYTSGSVRHERKFSHLFLSPAVSGSMEQCRRRRAQRGASARSCPHSGGSGGLAFLTLGRADRSPAAPARCATSRPAAGIARGPARGPGPTDGSPASASLTASWLFDKLRTSNSHCKVRYNYKTISEIPVLQCH